MKTNNKFITNFATVNLHITKACNYKCKFCFANFNETSTFLRHDSWTQIIDQLFEAGCQKITFVGGEPFLHPDFEQLLRYTSQKGITTTIVTNGSLIRKKFIEKNHYYIDWIGFSIDSQYEATELALGRTPKNTNLNHKHIGHIFSLLPTIRKYNIKIKVNTVVTSLNYQEDMYQLITLINPLRWKIFQVLPISGENDLYIDQLKIDQKQFKEFCSKHSSIDPIIESNTAMTGSYIMIDPSGRFFDNNQGKLVYSQPILEVGLQKAFQEINFSLNKLIEREGIYTW